jgi:ATP-dependent Clp protease ATP-binding subunit ClpC
VFERFTDRARRVLTFAQEEARLLNHPFIGTEHILLGLIHEGEGVGAQALASLGISGEAIREKVEEAVGRAGTSPTDSPPFTPRAKKVLELALREALQLNHSYIGTEHILLGLVREKEGVAAVVLLGLGADPLRVRQEVMHRVSSGQELQSGGREDDPPGAQGRPAPAAEPRCPQCLRSLGSGARYRTISVPSDSADADPLSILVVSCGHCGTTLDMVKVEDSG